jgi:hypothetical protein
VGQIGFEVTSPTNSRQCGLQAKINSTLVLSYSLMQYSKRKRKPKRMRLDKIVLVAFLVEWELVRACLSKNGSIEI